MSYPGYPGYGYGGAGPSYPPYPNTPTPPQHATASLCYPSVGFNAHGLHPANVSYPPQQPPSAQPNQAANLYPPSLSYPPAPSPSTTPYSLSTPYPPSTPCPPTYPSSGPYPSSSPYPSSGPYPSSSPYPSSTPYPPSTPYQSSAPYPPSTPYPSPYPTLTPPSQHCSAFPPPHNAYPSLPSATATQSPWGQSSSASDSFGKGNPTVLPAQPFDPRSDAEVLRKAMKGFGTDEKAIINVLAHRSNAQRQDIALQFKTLYGKDLVSDLKSELSGKFEDLIVAMMKPRFEFLAKEVHDAIAGIGTDEDVIIEVICTATNQEIHALKAAYQYLYKHSLEEDLRGDTSGHFKRMMSSLCVGNRSEDYTINPAAADVDAQALLRAGELRVGTDESTFNAILCQRSYPQLKAIMAAYQRVTGHSLEKAIRKEFSGDIEEGLVTILKCVENRPGFFAERLYKSMKGMGTDDRALVRLVVSRCEVDMGDVKQSFSTMYGKTLESFIEGDTSGDYKKCLLALVGA